MVLKDMPDFGNIASASQPTVPVLVNRVRRHASSDTNPPDMRRAGSKPQRQTPSKSMLQTVMSACLQPRDGDQTDAKMHDNRQRRIVRNTDNLLRELAVDYINGDLQHLAAGSMRFKNVDTARFYKLCFQTVIQFMLAVFMAHSAKGVERQAEGERMYTHRVYCGFILVAIYRTYSDAQKRGRNRVKWYVPLICAFISYVLVYYTHISLVRSNTLNAIKLIWDNITPIAAVICILMPNIQLISRLTFPFLQTIMVLNGSDTPILGFIAGVLLVDVQLQELCGPSNLWAYAVFLMWLAVAMKALFSHMLNKRCNWRNKFVYVPFIFMYLGVAYAMYATPYVDNAHSSTTNEAYVGGEHSSTTEKPMIRESEEYALELQKKWVRGVAWFGRTFLNIEPVMIDL